VKERGRERGARVSRERGREKERGREEVTKKQIWSNGI
jgi:hypothetical protein